MKEKENIRKIIWDLLEEKNVVTFPRPVYGRIPNFIGANVAAERLEELTLWRKARVIKSNPDSPQKWVRENALRHGKTVYMAVPRLREEKCFLKINPTITTVHPLQIVEYMLPMEKHDVPLDYIITRNNVITTNATYVKPKGIYWDIIGDKINEIPLLQKLKKSV